MTANATSGDFVAGIYVLNIAGATQQVYFNSVSMTGARGATGSQYGSFALALAGGDTAVDVKDNILYNTQTQSGGAATGKSYAYGVNSSTFGNLISDYNDLFVSGAQAVVGITGGLVNTSGTGPDHLRHLYRRGLAKTPIPRMLIQSSPRQRTCTSIRPPPVC